MAPLDDEYWDKRYESQDTPWDLGGAHPYLGRLVDLARTTWLQHTPEATLWVPGCGLGHDANALAQMGPPLVGQVVGIDFSHKAIQGAKERYGHTVRLTFACQNFLQPGAAYPHLGPPAVIFDRAMIVALDPEDRPSYVAACARTLSPGGLFIGIVGNPALKTSSRPGPPFPLSWGEQLALFQESFLLDAAEDVLAPPSCIKQSESSLLSLAIWRRRPLS